MQAAELGPVPPQERTQTPFTLFVIFVGANIVATALQVGASLVPDPSRLTAPGLLVQSTQGGFGRRPGAVGISLVGTRRPAPSVNSGRR